MSLRINHNVNAISAHRNLIGNDRKLSGSLERLASGLKINRAADGPSSLVVSEQMRAQIAGIDQAIKNSELSISMVQTAESALNEVSQLLIGIRQLSIHAANEGTNDDVMLQADQQEIRNAIETIDRIASNTQFGKRNLLDGSNGAVGFSMEDDLEFVKATAKTKGSGDSGFDVVILENASKASVTGISPLTEENLREGETLIVASEGKTAVYKTTPTETIESAVKNLAAAVRRAGIEVDVSLDGSNRLYLEHKRLGSGNKFQVSSTNFDVLSNISDNPDEFRSSSDGTDIKGTINGESAVGKGTTLTGKVGNETTEGLTISYTGMAGGEDGIPEEGAYVGKMFISQSSPSFQVGPNLDQTVSVAMPNVSSERLGRGIANESGFDSLSNIDVTNSQGAQDSIAIVDAAINTVSEMRGDLGSFQKNTLESNLSNLRVASENMVAAESTIRDADIAQEVAEFTRNSIMMQSASAMLAQANQTPGSVLRLLNSD